MAKVVNATTVNAMVAQVEHGLLGVALFRSDGVNCEQSVHGAYASRPDAWKAGDFMCTRLQQVINMRGSFTDEDVERVRRLADGWLRGRPIQFG